MLLLVGFAFLAGVVTVLSPCILPVLPVVLSGSVGGGKARPWGIITGFIASFTAFTLALSALIQAFGISADVLRIVAASLVLAFGLVMVIPPLKDAFMSLATRLTARKQTGISVSKKREGFLSGVVLGLSLGLVWTPCVGPIMASVITLALTQSVDAGSVFITLAYTLGTALPLFAIMQGGRALLTKFPFFTKHSSAVQKVFGTFMLLTSIALFTGVDRSFQTWILETFPQYGSGLTSIEDQDAVKKELDLRRTSKSEKTNVSASSSDLFSHSSGQWLNSEPLTFEKLKGKVVLVDIWTYSCINCIRTLPYLRAWYEKYHSMGLEIVGVHSPEFAFERNVDNLKKAMSDLKVTWPVVQDNDFGIWKTLGNQYWPAHYLYDKNGTLVDTHFGEGAYQQTETLIQRLLGANTDTVSQRVQSIAVDDRPKTPETYLGYARGQRFFSPESVEADKRAQYSFPDQWKTNKWALSRTWTITKESSNSQPKSRMGLSFQASKVYLVMNPLEGSKTVHVTIDGKPVDGGDVKNGVLTLDGNRLYQIFDAKESTTQTIVLEFDGQVALFALTFG